MGEIEKIRELRADLPPAGAEARAAARAALLEEIERRARPASTGLRSPWRSNRAGFLAAMAGALGLVAVALVLVLGGGEAGVQSAAARALEQAAATAAAQPPKAPPPGHYLFTRTREGHLVFSVREGGSVAAGDRRRFLRIQRTRRGGLRQHPWWVFLPEEREMWLSPNGSARVREVSGAPRFLSTRQRAAWLAAGAPSLPRAGRVSGKAYGRHGPAGLYFSRLPQLPTDPGVLRAWIEAHAAEIPGSLSTAGTTSTGLRLAEASHARLFADVGFLLGESFARPRLRAALYQVASELPGIELLGSVADPLGRRGVGVAYPDPAHGQRLELIFDPRTSTLLAELYLVTSPRRSGIAVAPGTIVGYTAHLVSKVVSSRVARRRP